MLRFTMGSIVLLVSSLSVSSSQVGSRAGARPKPQDPDAFMLVGRISPDEVGPYQGSSITAYVVQRGGKLSEIALDRAQSDRDGRYQIPVKIPTGETPDLIVEARHPGAKGIGMAIVPSWSAVDHVIIAPAIDMKSGLESEVYLEVLSAGVEPAHLGTSALRRLVTPRLAAELRSSHRYSDDLVQVKRALISATKAWRWTLERPDLGLNAENVALAYDALDWAQVMLDAELYAADTPEERERARENYSSVVGAAYSSAGIGPEHLAQAAQASADAMRVFASQLNGRMRAALISEAESLRARYVTGAVEALFGQVGAGDGDRQAVRSAGARLEGQILASVDAGKDIDAYLKRIWGEYRRSVLLRLQSIVGQGREQRVI
jgi:hypothetical protein